ncbi:MAG: 16S rRNA (cytidine(1402)-2'-O)-methyltransferase [Micromonosporaceae bacterium]|nr:16S rRNA (cytidine(1402)-2'-O)-methyltransferase [Micromonosporaceae bacterium]
MILLGAPLGNPDDASARFAKTLATADVIAAEDTRRLRRLARELGVEITGRVLSYFEGNEERRAEELLALLRDGATVAVVTDGGMPSVSDPGYRLVRAAAEAGVEVSAAPGPSAVTTALAVSGLPCDRFCFEGFLPRRAGERRTRLAGLADERRTMVFFEAPHRIAAAVGDLVAAFGEERPVALCRELTKTFEEVRRETLASLAASVAEDPPRGEITLVVGGAVPGAGERSAADLAALVAELEGSGVPRKQAIGLVAQRHGVPKREVYAAVIAHK